MYSLPTNNQKQKQSRTAVLKKTLKRVVIGILMIPAIFIAILLIMIIVPGFFKMTKLNYEANKLEKELSSLTFIEGKNIGAKGIVDGDVLTANSDPARSTFAEGSVEVSGKLAAIETTVNKNLSSSGYNRDGGSKDPYYAATMNGGSYDSIQFRYIKDDLAVRVSYKFDRAYTCPDGYVCAHTPKSKPENKTYPVYGFGKLPVKKLYISMSDKSSDYHSGYLYW